MAEDKKKQVEKKDKKVAGTKAKKEKDAEKKKPKQETKNKKKNVKGKTKTVKKQPKKKEDRDKKTVEQKPKKKEEEKQDAEKSKETKKDSDVKKQEDKKEKKKDKKIEKKKKSHAEVNARNARISTKHAIYICKYIKGKEIQKAISELNEVIGKKVAVPMRGEMAHKKGKGFTTSGSGRYPVKAAKEFTNLLKSLRANAEYNEMEEPYIIKEAVSNKASRPYRRFGSRRMKRTHVYLKAKSLNKK